MSSCKLEDGYPVEKKGTVAGASVRLEERMV